VLALTVGYGVAYLAVLVAGPGLAARHRIALVVALFALGVGYELVTGPASSPAVLGFAVSATMILLRCAGPARIGLTCVGGAALASWLLQGQVDWQDILILALITITTLAISRISRLVTRLHAARRRSARWPWPRNALGWPGICTTCSAQPHHHHGEDRAGQALLERRRPARAGDGGDPGHRGAVPPRAGRHPGHRVRAAAGVAGRELVTARAALRAAGIDADLTARGGRRGGRLEEPLAYVLREGVTNVVRHSGASRVHGAAGWRWLEVVDDGPGSDRTDRCPRQRPVRAGRADGRGARPLTAGPVVGGGYRLRAEVPE